MRNEFPFVVEPMMVADVDQVMVIEHASFTAPWSARAYRYEIVQNEHSTMLVVRPKHLSAKWPASLLSRLRSTKPVPILGYGGFWMLVDDIHISTIAVDPRWRGRGLGELLLLSLLERGAELGARRATLEVRVSNLAAQALYHKYGFRTVARQNRYYADNDEDAYIMATPSFETSEFQSNLRRCRRRLHARLCSETGPGVGGPGSRRSKRLDKTPQVR
jgi:ribosomal-protein-alanine N-acetyltransferase